MNLPGLYLSLYQCSHRIELQNFFYFFNGGRGLQRQECIGLSVKSCKAFILSSNTLLMLLMDTTF